MRNRLFKTRRGAIIVSAVTALAAALLLVLYLRSYKSSVNSNTEPERVLVATKLIPSGTSGTQIAQKSLYVVTTVPKNQLELNAIVDPSALNGEVAATNIFAGQQLTSADFAAQNTTTLNFQLTGRQRAIAIPVDALHSVGGEVAAGDFVDVYVEITASSNTSSGSTSSKSTASLATQVRLLASNIQVLAIPTTGVTDTVLRIDTSQAAKFAYTSDFEKFWLVLRPQTGAARTPPTVATLGSLLQGGA